MRRLRRAPVVWVLVGVLAVAVAVVSTTLTGTGTGDLSPDAPGRAGSKAVASLLTDAGVQVRTTTTVDDAERFSTSGTTLLVTDTTLLETDELQRLVATGADLVLVQPDFTVLQTVAPEVMVAGTAPRQRRDPACTDPDAVAAGDASAGGRLYTASGTVTTGTTVEYCYDQDAGSALVVLTRQGGTVTVLGQPEVLRNRSLTVGGNAALALRLLGHHERLVWFTPDPLVLAADDAASEGGLLSHVPGWAYQVWLQVLVALGVAALVVGRRFGPVVAEPLPVVVQARETAEGRARLWQRMHAREHAAATARAATLRRVTRHVDVPQGLDLEGVCRHVAQLHGLDPAQVVHLVAGPVPATDTELVQLCRALAEFEAGVAPTPAQTTRGGDR